MTTTGIGRTPPPFLLPVAARLREFDEGAAGAELAAVLPDKYERMAVGVQGLLLGAMAVVQEWDELGNDTGKVGFVNIGVLKAGLRDLGLLPVWGWKGLIEPSLSELSAEDRARLYPELPTEGQHGGPTPAEMQEQAIRKLKWGRDKGCEAP